MAQPATRFATVQRPKSRSQLFAEEHLRNAAYHGRQAVDHDMHREPEAAARHCMAIEAHEKAATAPLDDTLSRDGDASQRVGR